MIDLTFAHEWQADVLAARPLILPPRHFVYPAQVEEVERGALEVMIRPTGAQPFLATCALGFADPAAPSGVWSCPDPRSICIAAGGYAYLIDTRDPSQWQQVEYLPVTEVRALPEAGLLIFSGFHSMLAWGSAGAVWQSARLSWDGVRITSIEAETIHGFGWDMRTDQEIPFEVDIKTGQHRGGGYLR
jgi:hypothetical protein